MLYQLCTNWICRTCTTSTCHIWKLIWRRIYTSWKMSVSCIYGYLRCCYLLYFNVSSYHIHVYAKLVCRNWYLTSFVKWWPPALDESMGGKSCQLIKYAFICAHDIHFYLEAGQHWLYCNLRKFHSSQLFHLSFFIIWTLKSSMTWCKSGRQE